ncbi:Homoserine dehydrogenase [Paramicrosporidium saccamoebae]|uniref:Homoserine dehydrogenase n=1 Tax=Paramicrosporidium saccamoebae TaxID=1246581 RepID=A0A2H9THC8_9FUNG|nr:Homoserine dehydrogenase [Paramicrosporidium saccamoebae]
MSPACKLGLVLVGVGTVGAELADELISNEFFGRQRIEVLALCNSKQLVHNPSKDWRVELERSSTPVHFHESEELKKCCDHLVFVDCTASEKVAQEYQRHLCSGVSVVTANKKGPSGVESIFGLLPLNGLKLPMFGFESTVGAGLPVIKTIQSIINAGDQVDRIDGILSGTLAFLFNEFMPFDDGRDDEKSFLQILEDAKKLGYTEPNPLDDLEGMDVARKATIIARLIGGKVIDAATVASSLVGPGSLAELDGKLERLRKECRERGTYLRYIAQISRAEHPRKWSWCKTNGSWPASRRGRDLQPIINSRVVSQYQQHDHQFRKLQKLHERLAEKDQMVSKHGVVKLLRAYETALDSATLLQTVSNEASRRVREQMQEAEEKRPEEEIVSETVIEEEIFMDVDQDVSPAAPEPVEEPIVENELELAVEEEIVIEDSPSVDAMEIPLEMPSAMEVLNVGTEVAMLCLVDAEATQEDWILGTILRYIPEENSYEIEDAEGENGSPTKGGVKTRYTVHEEKVRPLADSIDESVKPKQQVLALFPGTTCLYPATVISTPTRRKKTKDFLVKFSDDEVPQRPVPPRYILSLKEEEQQS